MSCIKAVFLLAGKADVCEFIMVRDQDSVEPWRPL